MTQRAGVGVQPPPQKTRLVHHGGRLVPPVEAALPVGSIAMRYAISVFEGVRLYVQGDGSLRPWLFDEHLERLRFSCRAMELDDESCGSVPDVVDELLAVNGIAEDAYCRIAVSAGNAGDIGAVAVPVLTVSVVSMGRKRWLGEGRGMRLRVSSCQRVPAAAFPRGVKNISTYAGARLASAEARRAGYDECLLVSGDGVVSEAPTSAVFAARRGTLVTPRLVDDVLPSITRAWVLAVAPKLGIAAAADELEAAALRQADEAFLCGTGIEFGPVAEVDDAVLGGCPGPVTRALVDEYFRQARGEAPVTRVEWQQG